MKTVISTIALVSLTSFAFASNSSVSEINEAKNEVKKPEVVFEMFFNDTPIINYCGHTASTPDCESYDFYMCHFCDEC